MNWGATIESEYRLFLSQGEDRWQKWPVEMYDQLVADGIYEPEFYKRAIVSIRGKRINDLFFEKRKLITAGKTKKADEVQQQISQLSNGEKDGELETLAKQFSILKFFEKSKEKFRDHVYQPQ